MGKPVIAVLSGAGISAESGLKTFRDSGGLWEGYDPMQVASAEGWQKNPGLVLDFYNDRREKLRDASPNEAHRLLAGLEDRWTVDVITQNVDNLHERAGSTHVLHLHGELTKIRPENTCNDVPKIERAIDLVSRCDVMLIVGTSLQVYPAAGLYRYAPADTPIYVVDPAPLPVRDKRVTHIRKVATEGVKECLEMLK